MSEISIDEQRKAAQEQALSNFLGLDGIEDNREDAPGMFDTWMITEEGLGGHVPVDAVLGRFRLGLEIAEREAMRDDLGGEYTESYKNQARTAGLVLNSLEELKGYCEKTSAYHRDQGRRIAEENWNALAERIVVV